MLYFNPGDNRVYTDSEVNGESVIIDGPTDGCFKLPMRMATDRKTGVTTGSYDVSHFSGYIVSSGRADEGGGSSLGM